MINVAIYHQHKLILQCIENYLQQSSEIKPVFSAYDKDSLMQKMANRIVNVLILYFADISHNDVDLIISLKMKFPKTAILVMSDAKKDDIVAKTIKSGAKGFLSIDSDAADLLQAIYTIRGGHDYYSESITHILLNRFIGTVGADADENELYGGNGSDNAKLALEVLNGGGRKTIRYAVGLNAGAVLYLCGKARTLKDGYAMALEAIDSGKTLAKLKEIQQVSEELSA